MVTTVIISLCLLLLLSYFFDITNSFTKIPSVILLLALGWFVNQISGLFEMNIPDLFPLLPLLGTLGLILIVLEGTLELELDKSKISIIRKTSVIALFPLLILSLGFAIYLHYEWDFTFRNSLINMIPFAVISSAIAIPSSINLGKDRREFITYESSLSDIFGVIFFNFATFGTAITWSSAAQFSWQFLLMIVISIAASLLLAFLLGKIDHHIKYGPIIIFSILIYEIAKVYHLPALIFILFFGLILGNIEKLKHFKIFKKVRFSKLNREVYHFKEVVIEATFIIRSMFFLVFGFVMDTEEIFNTDYFVWSVSIVVAIFLLRFIFLKFTKQEIMPLLCIAPRGLVTVLLFLAITPEQSISIFNQTVVLQVVLLSTFIMMLGLMFTEREKTKEA